eukprot:scaffold45852_cov33-Attheya_sp.AAC.1
MDGGTWHEDKEQRTPGRTFATILTAFERCGYTVRTRVINAADHNVPQHRDRLFFVGFLDATTMDRFLWPTLNNDVTCHVNSINVNSMNASTTSIMSRPTLGSILESDDSVSVLAAGLTRDQCQRVQHLLSPSAGRSCRAARLDGMARTLMA